MRSPLQLLDRGISAEVELAAWCPTMDLLALVTVDGQLHVHRLNWQRLWWTAPEATVTGGGGVPQGDGRGGPRNRWRRQQWLGGIPAG